MDSTRPKPTAAGDEEAALDRSDVTLMARSVPIHSTNVHGGALGDPAS
jgi:hypothetical protein